MGCFSSTLAANHGSQKCIDSLDVNAGWQASGSLKAQVYGSLSHSGEMKAESVIKEPYLYCLHHFLRSRLAMVGMGENV